MELNVDDGDVLAAPAHHLADGFGALRLRELYIVPFRSSLLALRHPLQQLPTGLLGPLA